MWYRYSQKGKLVNRSGIPDFEKTLGDFIRQSLEEDGPKGYKINFDTLNSLLKTRPEFKKYILSFVPIINMPYAKAGYNPQLKQLYLPNKFNRSVFGSIIHEMVHAVDNATTLSAWSGISALARSTELTPNDLGKTYEEFFNRQLALKLDLDYDLFMSRKDTPEMKKYIKQEAFAFRPELTREEWNKFNANRKNVRPDGMIYFGLTEELPTQLNDAIRIFSAANLKRVYAKFYKGKPNGKADFLNYVRSAFNSQGKGPFLSASMKELKEKIHQANPGLENVSALQDIIQPQWWNQFSKNISDNYSDLLNEFKPSSVSKVDVAINARAARLKNIVDSNHESVNKFIKLRSDLFGNLNKSLGKSFITLGEVFDKIHLNSPLWQLAEPVIEILLIELGKYIEDPDAYSAGENKFNYVNKKIDDILSDKSITNKYKYFIDNYSSFKKQMDSTQWDDIMSKLNDGIMRQNLFNKK